MAQGWAPMRAMASRLAVASTSDWPPDRNAMPGTATGTQLRKSLIVQAAISSGLALAGASLAGNDHVGLEDRALEEDAMLVEFVVERVEDEAGDLVVALDGMGAVHQHLRLDDGHDVVFLADRGVAGERPACWRGWIHPSGARPCR